VTAGPFGEDWAERILVMLSVVSFWTTVVLLPLMLAWLWGGMAAAPDGGGKDPRLLLALVAVPLSPCFALLPVGLWHLRKFLRLRRAFHGIDLLPPLSLVCLGILYTMVADVSVGEVLPFMARD
jgi:hypothetical protein